MDHPARFKYSRGVFFVSYDPPHGALQEGSLAVPQKTVENSQEKRSRSTSARCMGSCILFGRDGCLPGMQETVGLLVRDPPLSRKKEGNCCGVLRVVLSGRLVVLNAEQPSAEGDEQV